MKHINWDALLLVAQLSMRFFHFVLVLAASTLARPLPVISDCSNSLPRSEAAGSEVQGMTQRFEILS